jgi:uncharacterized membrane protein YkoI
MNCFPSFPAATPALLVCLLALAAGPALAGDGHDHDRARQAVQAGEILPLKAILERLERSHPGQVMEVELEHKEGRWIYELKVLRGGGSMARLMVDAHDGTVLDRKATEVEPTTERRQPGARP